MSRFSVGDIVFFFFNHINLVMLFRFFFKSGMRELQMTRDIKEKKSKSMKRYQKNLNFIWKKNRKCDPAAPIYAPLQSQRNQFHFVSTFICLLVVQLIYYCQLFSIIPWMRFIRSVFCSLAHVFGCHFYLNWYICCLFFFVQLKFLLKHFLLLFF